jgi:nucleoside-diphosphate-sugar epimerase/dTDP-4-amino-4,6-dideoxygalactose transaminase
VTASTILITGGAGFLGSAAAAALLARGDRVITLDAVPSDRLPDHPGLERVTGDVRDAACVAACVARADRVLHLAAVAGVHTYLERTLDVLDVNILGTREVLLACHRAAKPVVMASTSEAYGKNPLELREDGDSWLGPPTNARWSYATSKLAGEHYAWALARHGLAVAAVRYFNAYGPRLDAPGEGRVVSQFLGALREGRPLRLVDGGLAVRCLCYVDDAIDATLRLLDALPRPDLIGRPFNVGNPEPVTMAHLAARMIALAAHPAGTEEVRGEDFFGPGFEEIPHRVPDVSALADALGWRAQIDLEDGLRRTLAAWDLLRAPDAAPTPPLIPCVRPQYAADARLLTTLARSLTDGRTTNAGPQVKALEAAASAALGVDGVLAVGSGADALNVALRAAGLRGAAILPAFTYVSTLNAVELAGLEPVLCDIDPHTWTMCPDHLAHLLASRDDVVAILPVCVFGVPPDLDRVTALAGDRLVVYDAAQALGTTADGVAVHPGPAVTTWSLHATKLVPGVEGGLVHCRDEALRARIVRCRTHGLDPDPFDHQPGYNAKLDELSAATALHSLRRLPEILAGRRAHADRLGHALIEAGWTLQGVPAGVSTNHQNLCARAPRPAPEVVAQLARHGVEARRYFHPPLHHLRRFAGRWSLPVTDLVHADLVSVPLHTHLPEATLRRLEAAIAATAA